MAAPRSLLRGLAWTLGLGALVWALAVAAAAVLAVDEEVDELLDDALRASAEGLAPALANLGPVGVRAPSPQASGELRYAWWLLDAQGQLLQQSPGDYPALGQARPPAGFSNASPWRLYARPLDQPGGLWLVVGQTRAERREALQEVMWMVALSSLGVALLGLPLLALRARQELRPLGRLSERLEQLAHEGVAPQQLAHALGEPERAELAPIHRALRTLGEHLSERLAFERAFAPQAAHLLRTPLAGMDAQLAVALKEAAPETLPRLRLLRESTTRLQRLVLALLRLFRSEQAVQRQWLDAAQLLSELPTPGLSLRSTPGGRRLSADPELLAAALLNLLDNAQRHGARSVWLEWPSEQCLLVCDDGPGMPEAERVALEAALQDSAAAADASGQGLGLRLAALVTRAHGGRLRLPPQAQGFAVALELGPPHE
ncbi:signal transduction histidine kinase [Inhella inkyongensis]|uniref:histidine kinase n=1 Tax=Inhella inkyongensis TaxID=392593 RepID=A0A840S8G4_9BURK|nr:ATP-binding protein [Inhella inkyongensis]MBB5204831.1 signal transduction histidine kinase [Inhella inkyongensis]